MSDAIGARQDQERLKRLAEFGPVLRESGTPSVGTSEKKEEARQFLDRVQKALAAILPDASELRRAVRAEIASAKKESKKYVYGPESAFLHTYFIPRFFDLIQTDGQISKSDARHSFLCEGYANISDCASGSPIRTQGHPFTKLLSATAAEVARTWQEKDKNPLAQACPDFAVRAPFPYNIVFEAKYFEHGSFEKASRDLVAGIYEAFFYRALPYVPPKKGGPAWDYDFACLIACDASSNGSLSAAWDSFSATVKNGLWEGGNVYVMLVRPRVNGTHAS
jgi:hypothetical protein